MEKPLKFTRGKKVTIARNVKLLKGTVGEITDITYVKKEKLPSLKDIVRDIRGEANPEDRIEWIPRYLVTIVVPVYENDLSELKE